MMFGYRLSDIFSRSPFAAVLRCNDAAQIGGNPGGIIE
jgi:hypothetical protein